jgi:hypothetical protein
MTTIGGRPVHWAADIYPMMSEEERADLLASIERNGYRNDAPVLIDESGAILDGRNRASVCAAIGVTPAVRTVTASEIGASVVEFVRSLNTRRSLTPQQKAVVAVNLEEAFAREAKERQKAAGSKGKEGGRGNSKTLPDEPSGRVSKHANESVSKAAKAAGAGVNTTQALKAVKTAAPEVFELVKAGKVNVSQAKAIAKAPEEERAAAVDRIANGEKPTAVVKELPREQPKARVREWDHDNEIIELTRLMNRIRNECPPERRDSLSAFLATWSRRLKEVDDVREAG